MKRPLFISLCLILVFIVANAQQGRIVFKSSENTSIVPAKFSKSGEPYVVFSNFSADKMSNELSTYDSKLNATQTDIPLTIKQGTIKVMEKEYVSGYDFGGVQYSFLCLYSMKDTTMVRQGVTILTSPVEYKKTGITEAEVMKYFIPRQDKHSYSYTAGDATDPLNSSKNRRVEQTFDYKVIEAGTLGKIFTGAITPLSADLWFCNITPWDRLMYSLGANMDWVFLLTPDGELYKVNFTKNLGGKSKGYYRGPLVETSRKSIDYISSPLVLNYVDIAGNSSSLMTYTETLFNDDAGIEYACYEYGNPNTAIVAENDRNGDYDIDYVMEKTVYSLIGISICRADGGTVSRMELPNGYVVNESIERPVSILDFGDRRYLALDVTESETGDGYKVLYDITGGASSVSSPVATVKADVTPTFMTAGTDVTVRLPQGHGGSQVAVVSTNGILMSNQTVQSGEGTAIVATDGFPSGMYIVTITDAANSSREACKIVIK